MNEVIIQQDPNALNSVGTIMTRDEWKEIPGEPRWVPTFIPETKSLERKLGRKGIRVERIDLSSLSNQEKRQQLEKVATCYAGVFADPNTWDEKTRCPVEDKFYGKDTEIGGMCACGQCRLDPAYPLDATVTQIGKELAKPDAALFVLKDKATDEVKGFTWSYTTTPEELVNEKWKTPEMKGKILKTLQDLKITNNQKITYFSESGILPELRGKGISKLFYSKRLEIARELGYPVIVRTNTKSAINTLANKFGMVKIFGPVVTLGLRRNGNRFADVWADTYFGGVDTENPERVLYALAGIS